MSRRDGSGTASIDDLLDHGIVCTHGLWRDNVFAASHRRDHLPVVLWAVVADIAVMIEITNQALQCLEIVPYDRRELFGDQGETKNTNPTSDASLLCRHVEPSFLPALVFGRLKVKFHEDRKIVNAI